MQEQAMYYIIQSDNDNSKMRLKTHDEFYEFSKYPLTTIIEKVSFSSCHYRHYRRLSRHNHHNRIYALRMQASMLKLVPRGIFMFLKFYRRR